MYIYVYFLQMDHSFIYFTFMKLSYYPIFNKRPESDRFLDEINTNSYQNIIDDKSKSNICLIGWWDWFMLDMIKKLSKEWHELFFGVNCWTLWFLLNDIQSLSELPTHYSWFRSVVDVYFLQATITTKSWETHTVLATNDIVLGNSIMDYYRFDITSPSLNKSILWTWLILSTWIWSTAYWLGNWGPIFPSGSQLLGIMWIASKPFHYTCIQKDKLTISVSDRYSLSCFVDGFATTVKDISRVEIIPCNKKIQLGFIWDFESKRLLLSQEKLGSSY